METADSRLLGKPLCSVSASEWLMGVRSCLVARIKIHNTISPAEPRTIVGTNKYTMIVVNIADPHFRFSAGGTSSRPVDDDASRLPLCQPAVD